MALQNVIEQCCTSFLQHERFPTTYEELQPIPLPRSGLLSYAGDDGGEKGQAYHLALDLEAGVVRFRFRRPDPDGAGAALLAPTLREVVAPGGARIAVLDLAAGARLAAIVFLRRHDAGVDELALVSATGVIWIWLRTLDRIADDHPCHRDLGGDMYDRRLQIVPRRIDCATTVEVKHLRRLLRRRV
jgi:hypothetical protein